MMKRHIKYLLMAVLLYPVIGVAQQNSLTTASNDNWTRAAMAYQDNGNFHFSTTYGQAVANLLIKAHKGLLSYPDIEFNRSNADYSTYLDLFNYLQGLRENPPTWEQLIKDEEAKTELKNAPPTAPVYAGDQAAQEHYSGKDSNGMKRRIDQK